MTNEKYDLATQQGDFCFSKNISVIAVIAGALIGVGLSFLLNLFSVAIGLSAATTNAEGAMSLAIGGFFAIMISTVIAMFMGGMVAGYLGRSTAVPPSLGVLYGFITWCVALLLMVLLASPIGRYVANYSRFIVNPTAVSARSHHAMPAMDQSQLMQADAAISSTSMETKTRALGAISFMVFILFFIGALASCYGGYMGMRCDKYMGKRGSAPSAKRV